MAAADEEIVRRGDAIMRELEQDVSSAQAEILAKAEAIEKKQLEDEILQMADHIRSEHAGNLEDVSSAQAEVLANADQILSSRGGERTPSGLGDDEILRQAASIRKRLAQHLPVREKALLAEGAELKRDYVGISMAAADQEIVRRADSIMRELEEDASSAEAEILAQADTIEKKRLEDEIIALAAGIREHAGDLEDLSSAQHELVANADRILRTRR